MLPYSTLAARVEKGPIACGEANVDSEGFGDFIGSNLSTQTAEITSLKLYIDSKIDSELQGDVPSGHSMEATKALNVPREVTESSIGPEKQNVIDPDNSSAVVDEEYSLAGADMHSGGLVEVQLPDSYKLKNEAETELLVRNMKKRKSKRGTRDFRAHHARDDLLASRFKKAEFHRLR